MTAHVADQDGINTVIKLACKIIQIDTVVFANFCEDGHAFGMNNRRRNSRKGERRDQNPRALGQIERLHRQEQRSGTRRHGQGIFRPHHFSEITFQKRNGAFGGVVAKQIASRHQAFDFGLCGGWDGFGVMGVWGSTHLRLS